MKKKLIIVAAFLMFATAQANAGIPIGHGTCINGFATYYEIGWGKYAPIMHQYISGCTE